eukprot:Nk52_evm12s1636 gene=Nk52_evmTU12s1636
MVVESSCRLLAFWGNYRDFSLIRNLRWSTGTIHTITEFNELSFLRRLFQAQASARVGAFFRLLDYSLSWAPRWFPYLAYYRRPFSMRIGRRTAARVYYRRNVDQQSTYPDYTSVREFDPEESFTIRAGDSYVSTLADSSYGGLSSSVSSESAEDVIHFYCSTIASRAAVDGTVEDAERIAQMFASVPREPVPPSPLVDALDGIPLEGSDPQPVDDIAESVEEDTEAIVEETESAFQSLVEEGAVDTVADIVAAFMEAA